MKTYLTILFSLLCNVLALSQEICNNGIDDDADGLIDFRDTTECNCKLGLDTTYKLIRNNSFEDTNCCPSFVGGGQLNCSKEWVQASQATSDYFNTCGLIQVSAPGMNPPPLPLPSGNGYAGLFNGAAASQLNLSNYKEYIGTCLTDTLFAGTSYSLSLNIAHGKGYFTTKVAVFGSNNCANLPFGITPFYQGCPSNGPNFVPLDSITITTSGTNWNTVTFNFIPPYDITTLVIGPSCQQMLGNNYYYLDGLFLSKSPPEPNAFVSDTGSFCMGSLRLFAHSDSVPLSYQWYKDSVAIAGANDSSYAIPFKQSGTYQVLVIYPSGCIFTESVSIEGNPFPVAHFSFDTVCTGLPSIFQDLSSIASGSIVNWVWSFPSNSTLQNPSHIFSGSGPFPVNLKVTSDSGCSTDITLNVVHHPQPTASFNHSPQQIYSYNPKVCFINTSINSSSFSWNFGFNGVGNTSSSKNPNPIILTGNKSGSYPVSLIAINQFGCADTTIKSFTVLSGNILFVPNTFTPNKDDINDLFLPLTVGITDYQLTIFNRWGELIFQTEDKNKGWDGTHLGIPVQKDSYIYVLRIKNTSNEVEEVRGHVNVIL